MATGSSATAWDTGMRNASNGMATTGAQHRSFAQSLGEETRG